MSSIGRTILLVMGTAIGLVTVASIQAQPDRRGDGSNSTARAAHVVEHWNAARRADAIPRDLVIDRRGLGYLRRPNGELHPHGHDVPAVATNRGDQTPFARAPGRGGGGSDSTPPTISDMDPGSGDQIGGSHTFSAVVTDQGGVKSVSFVIEYPDGTTTQTFAANPGANDTWSVGLQGFSDGTWSWWVVAKDTAKRGGNTATSPAISFSVATGSTGNPGSDVITNASWTAGGAVQTALGRIYFEMPNNAKGKGPWSGFVCSGTVVTDDSSDRSVILTAAHCAYDDVNKAFARNVLFIPDQAGTSGSATDLNCNNDPLGCWVPSFGVVDEAWTTGVFPNNIEWDYAYYVVDDEGAHAGTQAEYSALDKSAGSMIISFNEPIVDDFEPGAGSGDYTYALGYSFNADPNLMHCAEDMTTEGSVNWWLASCELSGGASGGAWVQPMDIGAGNGPIISVNSWGYTGVPGMAGPMFFDTSAYCLWWTAATTPWASDLSDGNAGIIANQSCQ